MAAAAASVLLPCKLVLQVPVKAAGDLFHEHLSTKPHELLLNASPGLVHACQLHQGEFGTLGCIMQCNFTIDGKVHTAKTTVEKVDAEKKSVTYKWLEGDFLDLYKCFSVTRAIETNEGGSDFLAYTLEYELLKPDDPHPLPLLQFYIQLINAMESHLST